MEVSELIQILSRGEDSKTQFKQNIDHVDALASEIVAFSNSEGGQIFIGVDDHGNVTGLNKEALERLSQLITNASSQSVKPPINPLIENIAHPNGIVMVVTVPYGISKPYMDKSGVIWVKNAGNKAKVGREEIQRMFQSSGLIHGDEIPATGLTAADIDLLFFKDFFQKEFGEALEGQENSLPRILENMNLTNASNLNIAGALLFAKQPNFRLPAFMVKAITYPGNDIHETQYLDSRDIVGKLSEIFQHTLTFITINLHHTQGEKSVNSTGDLPVPKIVFEELLANALIHRDYFISAPIRVFVFKNRVEIISPGHLPNNLTVLNIKAGNSNMRNPILASFATKLLPYRGLGNGIRRALKAYPKIELIDDRDSNLFKAIVSF
jgi:ATP-dependent DNA helicase RecG